MSGSLLPLFASANEPEQPIAPSRPRPFSIRLSRAERRKLEEAAGSLPLGAYIRGRLLGTPPSPKSPRRHRTADTAGLSQILALLGRSGLYAGLSDLGAAARAGLVVLTPELEAQIAAACADIAEIKRMLLRALGFAAEAGR